MCDHNGQAVITKHTVSDDNTHYNVTAKCPDCGLKLWSGIQEELTGEISYIDVCPAWHGKMMNQATEQINELMAVVADNARKRAALESEYREMTNRANQAQKAAENTAINRLNLLTSMRIRLTEIAVDLARCGDYDHKGKNEAILRHLAALLALTLWRGDNSGPTRTDDGDVPF